MNTQLSIGNSAIRQFDNLYSLNDLHKASGGNPNHKPAFFLRNEQTKALIEEINRVANSQLALKVTRGGDFQGTFACKELVYAYAMWISASFMLKVIRAYDALVNPVPIALANSSQKLHLRRLVEEKAKSLGGARGDYSLVWRKVHDVCQVEKIGELTPAGYAKARAYFGVEQLTGEWEHAPTELPAPVIPENMMLIPKLVDGQFFWKGKVHDLNPVTQHKGYRSKTTHYSDLNTVLVPFNTLSDETYEVHVRKGKVNRYVKTLAHLTCDINTPWGRVWD